MRSSPRQVASRWPLGSPHQSNVAMHAIQSVGTINTKEEVVHMRHDLQAHACRHARCLSHATTVLGGALQHRRGPPLTAHCTPSPSSGAREQSELGTGVALLECSGWERHMEMSCVKMLSHQNPQHDRTMSSPATAFCVFMQARAPTVLPATV